MAKHSPLGASATHRWMHCAASVQLIANFFDGAKGNSSEFSVGGHNAHGIAAACLSQDQDAWQYVGTTIEEDGYTHVATVDDAAAIQLYLDRVRALPNWGTAGRGIEVKFSCPDIHPDFYGESDLALYDTDIVDIWDYKHGVGVPVDVVRNTQLMMYAVGAMRELMARGQRLPNRVRLNIAQPRAYHPKGPIRSWETTRDDLERWVQEEWLPAAARTASNDPEYAAGDWCQFCPRKLVCPLLRAIRERTVKRTVEDIKLMEDYELAGLNRDLRTLAYLRKDAQSETYSRLMGGRQIAGSKLVKSKADRVWKDGTLEVLEKEYGDEAFEKKMKSPAVVEKMPGGTALVRQYAYKPDKGMTVADVEDVREGQRARTAKEVFGLT